MEENFENYLAGSDDDEGNYAGRSAANRYGGSSSRYGTTYGGPSLSSPEGWEGFTDTKRGMNSNTKQSTSKSTSDYDFDIDFSGKETSKKKAKKSKEEREKEKATERASREKRSSELKKSKEERMAELLGRINTERAAEKEKAVADAAARDIERQREALAQEQREKKLATVGAGDGEEDSQNEAPLSLASDSLEMSDTDFEVGGYKKKAEMMAKVAIQSPKEEDDDDHPGALDTSFTKESDENEANEENPIRAMRRHLSGQLETGIKPEDVANKFSLNDLATMMRDGDHTDEYDDHYDEDYEDGVSKPARISGIENYDLDDDQSLKDAGAIYASFESDRDAMSHENETVNFDTENIVVSSPALNFSVGMRLKARLFDWKQYYEGVVESVRSDGLYDIIFDDGERVEGISKQSIIPIEQSNEGSTSNQSKKEKINVKPLELYDPSGPDTPPQSPRRPGRTLSPSSASSSRRSPSPPPSRFLDSPSTPSGSNRPGRTLSPSPSSPKASRRSPSPPPINTRSSPSSPASHLSSPPLSPSRPKSPPLSPPGSPRSEIGGRHTSPKGFGDEEETNVRLTEKSPNQAEKMRNLFWGGMTNLNPSSSPSGRTESRSNETNVKRNIKLSPAQRDIEPDRVYSFSGKSRKIQLSTKKSPPPPPPPSTVKKGLKFDLETHNRGGADSKLFASVEQLELATMRSEALRSEVARLRLLTSSLEAETEEAHRNEEAAMARAALVERESEAKAAEIFRLNSLVKELQSTNAVRSSLRNVLASSTEATIPRGQLENIEREMAEQDRILDGYQKENEKLVNKLREAEKKAENVRNEMFKASARLGLEHNSKESSDQLKATAAAELRRRLESEQALRSAQETIEELKSEHANRISELKAEISILKQSSERSSSIESQKGGTTSPDESQRLIQELRKELNQAREEHLNEAKSLKSKLTWYIENQELLSSNTKIIEEQRERIRVLEGNTSLKGKENGSSSPQHNRLRVSLPSDLKRIRDLEKLVKELEEALRKRHPDSLANLILAAGPGEAEKATRRDLKRQISELQEELENKEKSFNNRLRGLRQEYDKMKLNYEKQITDAKAMAATVGWKGQFPPLSTSEHDQGAHSGELADREGKVVALELELVRVREFYRKKIEQLSRKQSLALRAARKDGGTAIASEGSAQRDADKLRAAKLALEARVEELESLLEQYESPGIPKRRNISNNISSRSSSSHREETLLEENEVLRKKIDELEEFHSKRESKPVSEEGGSEDARALTLKVELLENENRKLKNRIESMINATSTPNLGEPSHVTLNNNKDQENHTNVSASISHFERALARSESAVKRLFAANCELEAQLQEAKRQLEVPVTPSMLQHQSLARRLSEMESKFQSRERELELLVQKVKHRAEMERDELVMAHNAAIASKNNELMKFRLELDSLVESIKLLQEQSS